MSTFDPSTGRVHLRRGASAYEREHELAHADQQRYRSLAWRAHERLGRVPYFCRFVRLWVEWEAARMALRRLKQKEQWTPEARREAVCGLLSYVRALFGW